MLADIKKKGLPGPIFTFVLCFVLAFLILLPFLVIDKGFFLYCGDFNSQQIPFHTYAINAIHTGAVNYSWVSDLGSSFMNTYSFYLLGSPFFALMALFPASFAPYLLAPFLCLKFGVAGLGAYLFASRYIKIRNYAALAAVLYAFSGFGVYNIFFNHFIDVVALFPFLLWSLDRFVYDGKRGLFPLFVALNLLNNYFFFVGQVVFLFIYFICKVLAKEYKLTPAQFLQLAFEALLGCFMGILFLIPAVLNLLQNPRTLRMTDGFGFITYGKVHQYLAIFASLFFPPDPPYLPNMFTDAVVKWTSLSAYLPLVSFAGTLAYLRARRTSAFAKIFAVCCVMALVPILNSAFYALNSSYYARWFYMPILIMAVCTAEAVRNFDFSFDVLKGIKTTAAITLVFTVIGIVPKKIDDKWSLGVASDAPRFWLTLLTALLGLLVFYALYKYSREHKRFSAKMLAAVMCFTLLYSIVHISIGKFPQNENDLHYKEYVYDNKVELPDDHFYRTNTHEMADNFGLHQGLRNINFFNSIVTPSILEFYPKAGIKRDVSSKPPVANYAMNTLLSVEFIITSPDKIISLSETGALQGYTFYSEGEYTIFRNENFVPMGFVYDEYVTQLELDNVFGQNHAAVLIKAIGLSEEQIERYGQYMRHVSSYDLVMISYDTFVADAAQLRDSAAQNFVADTDGFSCDIYMDAPNLVFFSVPYDKGFTAYVNGERTPIEKVSDGMTAIFAPQGQNHIVFEYSTPGLRLSTWLTLGGIAIFILYTTALYMQKKRAKKG